MGNYNICQDMFDNRITNIFDAETDILIGTVKQMEGWFLASPKGKPEAQFFHKRLAFAYVGSAYYGTNRPIHQSDAEQKTLLF